MDGTCLACSDHCVYFRVLDIKFSLYSQIFLYHYTAFLLVLCSFTLFVISISIKLKLCFIFSSSLVSLFSYHNWDKIPNHLFPVKYMYTINLCSTMIY